MRNHDPVEHYVDGRAAWRIGVLGLLTRLRGILTVGLVSIISMGVPWWWTALPESTLNTSLADLITATLGLVGLAAVASLYYLRHRARRSLKVKFTLHQIAHHLRDQYVAMAMAINSKRSAEHIKDELCANVVKTCNHVRDYFRLLTQDDTLEVAVRLAVINDSNEVVYRTVARSSGLSAARDEYTEDVRAAEGIVRFLREKKNRGVLLYNDLHAAERLQLFRSTENERRFPEEIVTMMVAPLNGWDTTVQGISMLGILYVTSRETGVFNVKYTDSMLFVADSIAHSIGSCMTLLR